jgi:hypothetical protein
MLSLPQGSEVNDSIALGPLLRMISGMEISKWESYDEAAHKYDMAGPIFVMRFILISPRFLALCVVAILFDWAKLAAGQSLTSSIGTNSFETSPETA